MAKTKHPTIFAFDGSIQVYEDGTMLELHTKVTKEEWEMIVEETVKYLAFVECLKEVAVPALDESWDEEDDWFRIQLDIAVSRMRNIDTLLVSKFNIKGIKEQYTKEMKKSADKMVEFIKEVKAEQKILIQSRLDKQKTTKVSDL